jgi:hypothetical protein
MMQNSSSGKLNAQPVCQRHLKELWRTVVELEEKDMASYLA